VTKGALSARRDRPAREEFKINGQYVNTPAQGVVGIPFFDEYVEKASLEYLDRAAKAGKPFFMSVNFMKVHQPNMPHPDFIHKSMSKSKYADSLVENDTRIGRVMDKVRALGLDKNTYVFWTTDNGAWQDVYPDAGYTPFRGTKGTVREAGNRVPAMPGVPRSRPARGTTTSSAAWTTWPPFAALAGIKLPDKDREASRCLRQLRHVARPLRHRQVGAQRLVLLHRERAEPRAARVGQLQGRVQPAGRQRASDRRPRGRHQPGLEGRRKYVAGVPQVFDLWQDPQERYDIFMNNFTERTWTLVTISDRSKRS
jgi:arylsulfatase